MKQEPTADISKDWPEDSLAFRRNNLLKSRGASYRQWLASVVGNTLLLAITSSSVLAILFIYYFIAKDAIPFFQLRGFKEFFTSTAWYPSAENPSFGALAIFVGSGLVTLGAILVAVPIGVSAAVCLSDIVPFALRQWIKPVIEILAAIPSVAFGFFALVVFAPLLQERGGRMLAMAAWMVGTPVVCLLSFLFSDIITSRLPDRSKRIGRVTAGIVFAGLGLWGLVWLSGRCLSVEIASGTNVLNVSIILGIMALPTIVSISEDALQNIGRDLREGSYALGATRAETMLKVIIPAARSGICAAIILGIMRAIGETMVVWMASGNAAHIPTPWYNVFAPVRTLTATIAGEMGEADQVTGSARYHVLFAMAFCLLTVSYLFNLLSERIVHRSSLTGR